MSDAEVIRDGCIIEHLLDVVGILDPEFVLAGEDPSDTVFDVESCVTLLSPLDDLSAEFRSGIRQLIDDFVNGLLKFALSRVESLILCLCRHSM